MTLPMEAAKRKSIPLATGLIDYFPDALAAVAELSLIGGQQHNPGKPLFWDRSKSTDHGDCLMRHFLDRGTRDADGVRHSAKVAWRALALLQVELERAAGFIDAAELTTLSQEIGPYDDVQLSEPSTPHGRGHPMAAEALRDEYSRDDNSTGV